MNERDVYTSAVTATVAKMKKKSESMNEMNEWVNETSFSVLSDNG